MKKMHNTFFRRYIWPGWSWTFASLLVIVLAAGILISHYTQTAFRSYQIEFVVETDREVEFAIYYDIGRGYNEVDHQSKMIEEVGVPTRLQFCIPVWTELEKIRFDPAKQQVRMTVYSITIIYDDATRFAVPLNTLEPQRDISRHEFDGKHFVFTTDPEGDDPIIELKKIGNTGGSPRWREPSSYLAWMAAGLILLFFGRFLYRFFILGL